MGNFDIFLKIYVYIFSIIAIAILLIACINFVNLATARSANRGKEVGIRKTVGSTRIQLFRQFMVESIFMSAVAIVFALLIIEFILPYFNSFTGKHLSSSYLENIFTIPVLLGIVLMVGILAGTYPAFFLASFNPVTVLKSKTVRKSNNSLLRNILVVFQNEHKLFISALNELKAPDAEAGLLINFGK